MRTIFLLPLLTLQRVLGLLSDRINTYQALVMNNPQHSFFNGLPDGMPMRILVWNCRGAGNEDFLGVIRDLISVHDPVILVLVETRISGDRADEVSRRIGFSSSTRMETQGFSGGIWVF